MYHYTYTDISDHVATLNRFSSISAQAQREEGGRHSWIDVFLRPPLRFLRGYFLKRGFLDGFPGFLIAVNAAYGVFIKYAKLWEICTRESRRGRPQS
jgi:hypothetical protein